MKKIIYLIIVVAVSINCKAQVTIMPIEDFDDFEVQSNTYVMDVDGLLNLYVGTWLYTDGTTSLKFVLRKEVNDDNGYYHEDVIYGEYQYIEEGIEKVNTLSLIDNVYTAQSNHTIVGNYLLTKNDVINYGKCDDCGENEKRLLLFMSDPITQGDAANLVLRRITVDGQPAISAMIHFGGLKTGEDPYTGYTSEFVGSTVPNGTYVLIKQP
jgi:hypothetical protein